MLRLLLALVALPSTFCLTHLVWYALPKLLKRTALGQTYMPFSYAFYDRDNVNISMVVSALASVAAMLFVLLVPWNFRRRRRALHGLCVRCGYDLRASPMRCPECGSAVGEGRPSDQ